MKRVTDPEYSSLCEHRCIGCGVMLAFTSSQARGHTAESRRENHEKELCPVCQGVRLREDEQQVYNGLSRSTG